MTSIAVLTTQTPSPLATAIRSAPWRQMTGLEVVSESDAEVLVVVLDHDDDGATWREAVSRAGERPVLVVMAPNGRTDAAVAERSGVRVLRWTPLHETRVRPTGLDPRGDGDLVVTSSWALSEVTADVEVLATANQAFTDHPVLTWRPSARTGVVTFAGAASAWTSRRVLRLIGRWAEAALGAKHPASARVGLLAFGAIGAEHAEAINAVPGLELTSVCDQSEARLSAASTLHPGVTTTKDAQELLADDNTDVIVISTPPDSHARWALAALERGKHVVLEKPMALTVSDCDQVMARAADEGLLAVVYQNRRYDTDFLTMRSAIDSGRVGDVFHVETFVGGYGHPCNYWHSDATVSGGAIFDWGSHFLDQILNLMPGDLAGVSARNHKLRWHDVTNADHARVTLHFADGAEATFIHSDLAAAPKPKYYVLGTEGALVGQWRTERMVSRTTIGTASVDTFAPADAPADIEFMDGHGSVTHLAPVHSPAYAFHRDLADAVLAGMPMEVSAAQSRRVVAVMEAAEQSAAKGSVIVPVQ